MIDSTRSFEFRHAYVWAQEHGWAHEWEDDRDRVAYAYAKWFEKQFTKDPNYFESIGHSVLFPRFQESILADEKRCFLTEAGSPR